MVMLVLLMASITAVYADTTSDIKSIDSVISEIRTELKLKPTDQINPGNVRNDLLEQLGDSVMEAMIGNHDLHEQMEARMGGEESATLISRHIRMGDNYLFRSLNGLNLDFGLAKNGNWNHMMGYTGWGMMNGFAGNSIMNYPGWGMTNREAATQSWSSQAPCWNDDESTPGSTYQEPSNSNNTTNSGNWSNMNWNNGMMN